MSQQGITTAENFAERWMPEPNSGCWLWLMSCNTHGYGNAAFRKRLTVAHRISWELHIGPIPEGLHVLHKCDVRACVNPDHLFLGTNADNIADRDRKGRGRQPRGEQSGMAKLTEAQVREIRAGSGESQTAMAARFGVTPGLVCKIANNRCWRHL